MFGRENAQMEIYAVLFLDGLVFWESEISTLVGSVWRGAGNSSLHGPQRGSPVFRRLPRYIVVTR